MDSAAPAMAEPSETAFVLFAHGARDPEWAEPFKRIERAVAEKTRCRVELAFLELMHPSLQEALSRLAQARVKRVKLFPLFLAQGGHMKQDLPRLVDEIEQSYPNLAVEVAPALGEVDSILEAITAWICER
jgi:sirohydrochlorin cobaltochelatase